MLVEYTFFAARAEGYLNTPPAGRVRDARKCVTAALQHLNILPRPGKSGYTRKDAFESQVAFLLDVSEVVGLRKDLSISAFAEKFNAPEKLPGQNDF